ncbi:MAG: response regulator [Daejeonella sp.]
MKKRIVVVERERDILEIVTHILTDRGFLVIPYQSEQGIFENIVDIMPDVILLDIVSVSEIGTELCRKIKKFKKTKHIPVIVLSTHTKAADVKEICAEEVISKPFDVDQLISKVEEHVC